MFKTVTPDNIMQLSLEEILPYINDRPGLGLPSKERRLKLVQVVFKILGLDLTPDVAMCMVAEPKAMQIIAAAGAGKTTISQAKALIEKIVRPRQLGRPLYGNKLLCIVYNKHNVKPMKAAHRKMVGRLRNAGVQGIDSVDEEINAMTLHSFCSGWKDEYAIEYGLEGHKVMPGEHFAVGIMESCFRTGSDMLGVKVFARPADLYSMYLYSKEKMLHPGHEDILKDHPKVQVPSDLLDITFKLYDSMKQQKKVYDYVDLLVKTHELLTTNEKFREHVRRYYDYIIVDECQDFTPIMIDIIRLVAGDKTDVLAVGDEDQTVYEFNGADVMNVLNFSSLFEGGEVYTMTSNRRCPGNVVRLAEHILLRNTLRFGKSLRWIKDDGNIEAIPYSTDEGQMVNIVRRLENMTDDERSNTIICYRDKVYSSLLVDMLEEKGIAFHTLSGVRPLSHELYQVVISVLDTLYAPMEPTMYLNLYKALPIYREELEAVLGWDPQRKKFRTERQRAHFATVDFGKHSGYEVFKKELRELAEMSKLVGSRPLSEYFPKLFDMICKYYWNYKKSKNANLALDNIYTEKVAKFFNSNKTYNELFQEYVERRETIRRYELAEAGVALSTFHKLKGLEYKNVIITYMDDAVFPSKDSVRPDLTEHQRMVLMESETRLCHVAVTRSTENLYVYYNHASPSVFAKMILTFLGKPEAKSPEPKQVMDMTAFLDPREVKMNNSSKGGFLSSALGKM